MTPVALRPATPADSEFCYQLHKAAMGGYIAAIWGWDEQVQRDFHARAFNPARWQIITADGTGIGMLDIEYRPGEIYLARIDRRVPVLPDGGQGFQRGRGGRALSGPGRVRQAYRRALVAPWAGAARSAWQSYCRAL